ncbi:MAG: 50S ribosomal protein L17 [Candidatus Pacebacteria bacterium]|nr:50S ribosomal protein L17 [Candidatus Paceibacterota bacterium]
MRKRKSGRKLSLKTDQRKALLKSMASALFLKGRIKATAARAKEVSIFAEKLITRAKAKNLPAKRELEKYFTKKLVKKLIEEIAPKYANRNGGYTRILKLGRRSGDGAQILIIELVS